jgi:hypothetical protein
MLIIFSLLVSNSVANIQLVVMDETLTDPTEELDVKIYPTEPLPASGTVIVDITEADDIDIETIPPEGVTVVMTNTTKTVTNEDIEIPDQDDEDTGTAEDEDDGMKAKPTNLIYLMQVIYLLRNSIPTELGPEYD